VQFLAVNNRFSQQGQRCPFFGIGAKINGIWLQDVIFQNTGLKIGPNANFNNIKLTLLPRLQANVFTGIH
jgi:hypothetical protein